MNLSALGGIEGKLIHFPLQSTSIGRIELPEHVLEGEEAYQENVFSLLPSGFVGAAG